jgi:hypothetical protein
MRRPVWFVDTSVFLNLLPMPMPRFQEKREQVIRDYQVKLGEHDSLVLPIATVIESGDHIAQLPTGHERRQAAVTFSRALGLVASGEAPWVLFSSKWDGEFLRLLLAGAATGIPLVEHAMHKVGCGDLSILVERETYRERTGLSDVRIWTLDAGLAAHR